MTPKINIKQVEEASICFDCAKKDFCYLKSDPALINYYCEEYSCESLVREKTSQVIVESEPKIDESTLKGLYVNCENRNQCSAKKPESGIWHCEEYK